MPQNAGIINLFLLSLSPKKPAPTKEIPVALQANKPYTKRRKNKTRKETEGPATRIVILDGGTTNPGDISWGPLEALGEVCVYEETPASLTLSRAKDADALIVNRVVLDRDILGQLPRLRFIGTLATGYNTIDGTAARALGVTVCNVPFYCVETVAQHAFSLLLCLCGNVHRYSEMVRAGKWDEAVAMSHGSLPLFELTGKKLGILGYGNIGACVAKLGLALGMEVLLCSRTVKEAPAGCRWTGLKELFQESDVVSIHCPLTVETRGLIDRQLLFQMKPTAFLINTSRGAVINSLDLAEALNSGKLAGAGLDVLDQEPPPPGHPLLSAKNCIITPHIAWASREARERLVKTVAENLKGFLEGHPQNVVNS